MKELQKITTPAQLRALLKKARKRQGRAEKREIRSILRRGRGKWQKVKSPVGKIVRVSIDRMRSERGKELKAELQHAFLFADMGCRVFLPKEEYGVRFKRSFDAIVNGVKFEFKHIKGNARGAEKRCREGLEQCQNISFYISKDAPSEKYEYIQKLLQAATKTKKEVGVIVAYFQADDSLAAFCFSKTKKARNA